MGAERQRACRPSGRLPAQRGLRHDLRNVTVFADGEVDRSPWGSGTCARLAVLADQGRVAPAGPTLRHESIVGSAFTGTVLAATTAAGRPAIVPQVTGMAYRTGEHTFVVDPADPLVPGFVLR
jgi:proline racemase